MNSYIIAKNLHVASVVVSVSLFLLRGIWVFRGSQLRGVPLASNTLARVLPHVVDTVLLGSAIWLTLILAQYPLQQPWLTAKVVGLLVYIGLGTVALKRRKLWAFVLALVTVSYVIAVAVTRDPFVFS